MADDTWTTVEKPVLEAIASLEEEFDHRAIDDVRVQERSGLDAVTVRRSLRKLAQADYLAGHEVETFDEWTMMGIQLTAPARRAVGQWPSSDPVESFLQILDRLIEAEPDPAEQGTPAGVAEGRRRRGQGRALVSARGSRPVVDGLSRRPPQAGVSGRGTRAPAGAAMRFVRAR